ncbi:hypothetical protein ACFX13_048176 [Malus domestica]
MAPLGVAVIERCRTRRRRPRGGGGRCRRRRTPNGQNP